MVEHPPLYHYPFYRVDSQRGRPSLFGSGILIEVGIHPFLISAAHVFDELDDSMSFPEAGITTPQSITVSTSPAPPTGRRHDLIDIGVASLPEAVAEILKTRFRFLQVSDLDPYDSFSPDKKYCFTGFPETRTRPDFQNRALHIDCYEFRLDAIPITADTPPWHLELHVAGQFIRGSMRQQNGQQITAPEPNGMSGGGVWTFSPEDGYKLVGLGINWDATNQVLIGVKIGAALCFLRELHPDLRSTLPYDPRISIRF